MRIRCAQCDRLVDEVVTWTEPRGYRRIVAHCHGEEDTMILTEREIADLKPEELEQLERAEGVAFRTPKLTAA